MVSDSITAPKPIARLGGVLYLTIIAIGIFGEAVVRGGLIVYGNMSATANNIQQSMSLWRFSVALELVLVLCATGLAYIFYTLLKRVDKKLATVALVFNIVAIAIEACNRFNLFSVLILLADERYLNMLGEQQLYAQVQFALDSYTYGFGASLAVFGIVCMMLGRLVYTSQFLPKFVGVLLVIAGICYISNTFVLLLSPGLSAMLFPWVLIPCFVAELTFALWLLVRGVDFDKWQRLEA